jgi:DNA-directed RNA polymerase specialized sigma24 family protein
VIARTKRQAPEAKAKLEAFAEDLHRREAELEKQQSDLRQERDEEIRAAYQGDLPMEDIAQVIDLHLSRVHQIIRS